MISSKQERFPLKRFSRLKHCKIGSRVTRPRPVPPLNAIRARFLEPGMEMIFKPFAVKELATKVGEILGA
jgi:hypothetical protein